MKNYDFTEREGHYRGLSIEALRGALRDAQATLRVVRDPRDPIRWATEEGYYLDDCGTIHAELRRRGVTDIESLRKVGEWCEYTYRESPRLGGWVAEVRESVLKPGTLRYRLVDFDHETRDPEAGVWVTAEKLIT